MGTRISGNSTWLGSVGSIYEYRIDPAVTPTNATFNYDLVSLINDPASWASGPYSWDFSTAGNDSPSGNNSGRWIAAKHDPFSGTVLNVASGVATITGSGTLAIESLGIVIGSPSTYAWVQIDVNPSTQSDRNDLAFRYVWQKDGLRLSDNNSKREWLIPTNKETKRYNFYLPYTADQGTDFKGNWDGFSHGVLLQFGAGEEGINSVAIDNFKLLAMYGHVTITP